MKTQTRTGFDRYLAGRMKDTSFAAAYREARLEIDSVDALIRALDAARTRQGISKAELARRAGSRPEAVRRLLTMAEPNPTIGTVVSLARSMGYSLALVPTPRRRSKKAT
jgi:DNA-binding phage protein